MEIKEVLTWQLWLIRLELAPTNVAPSMIFEGEDYDLKVSINDKAPLPLWSAAEWRSGAAYCYPMIKSFLY